MVTTITHYNGNVLVEIPNNVLDTNTSLNLPGTGYKGYGAPVLENMVWIMENFSGTVAPPTAIKGQLWYDTTGNVLKIYNGSAWAASGSIVSSTTAPASPVQGTMWWDYTNKLLNTWNGNSWTTVGPVSPTAFWNGIQNNAPSADNTYSLGNVNSRFSTIYTTGLNASADTTLTGALTVGGISTVNDITAMGNAQVRGSLVAQNGVLAWGGIVVNGGVSINDTGLTVAGPATISSHVGIGKAIDPFYSLDVNGSIRGNVEMLIQNTGPVYTILRDDNAPIDSKVWAQAVDDTGTYSKYICDDGLNPATVRYYMQVERSGVNISNVKIYTGNNDLAVIVDANQNLVVNYGSLKLSNQGVVFADGSRQTTAGSGNLSIPDTVVTAVSPALFGGTMKNTGWQKLPSGMIMQWGFVDFGTGETEGLGGPYPFPVQFSTVCSSITVSTVTPENPLDSGSGDNQINISYNYRPTSSQFWIWNNQIGGGTLANGFYWQAIGY